MGGVGVSAGAAAPDAGEGDAAAARSRFGSAANGRARSRSFAFERAALIPRRHSTPTNRLFGELIVYRFFIEDDWRDRTRGGPLPMQGRAANRHAAFESFECSVHAPAQAARGARAVIRRAIEEQAMLAGMMLIGSAVTFGVWAGRNPLVVLNAAARRPTFVGRFGLTYGAGPRRALDVYLQAAREPRPAGGGAPLVVFFYGGSWQRGRRGDYRFVGEALASRGCVVAIPDYRLYPDAVFPGFVEDAAAAVRWARDHAAALGADPRRIHVAGHSAGAQIATLLATDSRFLRAHGLDKRDLAGVVGLAGPYDFLPLEDATLKRIFPEPVRDASQPIRFVDGREPPMLLASGLRDATVKPGNTVRFASRVAAAGGAVQVRLYPGIGHALLVGALGLPMRRFLPVLDDVAAFVRAAPRAPA